MVKREVATYTSTIKIFGKYTQICTNITFNKDVIKTIENNKCLERSVKRILHKYERTEIVNCIYCGFSLLYNKNTPLDIFGIKRATMLTERVCKDKEEANSVVKDQEKVAKSIVRLLNKKILDSRKAVRSTTRIFKNDRNFQVCTKILLPLRERSIIQDKYIRIENFAFELTRDYKYERNERLDFKCEHLCEVPFGCGIILTSFVDKELYNKRLSIVNKHKRIAKMIEKILSE